MPIDECRLCIQLLCGRPMQVHVEDLVLGTGDTAEQVVSLAGPLQQMQIAMPIILEKAGKVGKG